MAATRAKMIALEATNSGRMLVIRLATTRNLSRGHPPDEINPLKQVYCWPRKISAALR